MAVGELALGLYQTISAQRRLNKLNKVPLPDYQITPEQQGSFNTAMLGAKYGFDQRQRGNFLNNLSSSNNQAYQRAVDLSGGQMSSALGRIMQGQNVRALNQFAADDAGFQFAKRQYADRLGKDITNQRNMKTSTEIQRRMMLEQALGAAKSDGISNIASGLNSAEALAMFPVTGGL